MRLILDGQQINNKDDFYEQIRQQLSVPEYFSDNLDALHDLLSEALKPVPIVIKHFSRLRQALGGPYLIRLLTMLTDCGSRISILS